MSEKTVQEEEKQGLEPGQETGYTFKSQDGLVCLELENLTAVENVSRVIHFYMKNGQEYESVYIRQPFEQQLADILQDRRFIQPHKSFLINMEYVEQMLAHDFKMCDGRMVPISRNNLAAVKKQYLEYLSASDKE